MSYSCSCNQATITCTTRWQCKINFYTSNMTVGTAPTLCTLCKHLWNWRFTSFKVRKEALNHMPFNTRFLRVCMLGFTDQSNQIRIYTFKCVFLKFKIQIKQIKCLSTSFFSVQQIPFTHFHRKMSIIMMNYKPLPTCFLYGYWHNIYKVSVSY